MLTYHRKSVCLSLISTDLPVWSVVETSATLYQKDNSRFHLLLTAPPVKSCPELNLHHSTQSIFPKPSKPAIPSSPRILWLEISPYRVTMTMQGNPQLSYRHFWERGVYGFSRYWLPADSMQPAKTIRLRNFTRQLQVSGHPIIEHLKVEYELWTGKVQLGSYILNLEIH